MRLEKSLKMLQMYCKHDVNQSLHGPGSFIMHDSSKQAPESHSLKTLDMLRPLKCLKRRSSSKIIRYFVYHVRFKTFKFGATR